MDEIDLLKGFRDDMPEPTTDAWLRARAAIAAARAETNPKTKATISVRWFRPLYAVTLAAVAVISAVAGAFLAQTRTTTQLAAPAPTTSATVTMFTKVASAIQNDANYVVYTQATTVLSTGAVYTGAWLDDPWTGAPGTVVRQAGTQWVGGTESGWALSFVVPPTSRLRVGSDNECQLTPYGISIDYTNHTWQDTPPPCVTLPPGLDLDARAMRIVGYPVVSNQKTIEFRAVSEDETFTLWIDNTTYLPLQSQTVKKDWTEQEQYTYDPPTAANQAKLTMSAPRGFTQTLGPGGAS
jgi:hypothetical protein